MAIRSPGTADPQPQGPQRSAGRLKATCLSREEAAQQRGKKLLQAVAGIRLGSAATVSWGVIRHQKGHEVRRAVQHEGDDGSRAPELPWATPNSVALELPSMRLRDFSTHTQGQATLICAPYALHGATVADFAPGHSVVEALRLGGLSRVFATDWRSATPEMRYLSIDNCLADLNVAVDELGSMKHPAKRSISPIAWSVARNSNAPASDVIAPPSNPATTNRRSTPANSNSSALHSVGTGAPLESLQSPSRKRTFADSALRCAQLRNSPSRSNRRDRRCFAINLGQEFESMLLKFQCDWMDRFFRLIQGQHHPPSADRCSRSCLRCFARRS